MRDVSYRTSGTAGGRWCARGPALALLLTFLLSGCIGLIPSPFRPSPGPKKTPQVYDLAEAFDIVCRNYRVGPDDELSILFQTEWSIPAGSYRLDTLDEIGIKFSLDSSLNEEVVIRPDGMITVQGIGDVKAVGLTPEELARRIEQKLVQADILDLSESMIASKKYKLVTVHVLKFYQKVDQLVKSLTTLTGGQQTAIRVNPDGTVDLPLVRERVIAAGQTVPALERTVNMLYKRTGLKHVVVSLSLANARSRKVYVMGQVGSPGAYEIRQPITALHAIALAGGAITEKADLTSVILISKNIHGKPIGRRLDLKRILDVGDMSPAILVKPYDVLYVPKTYIQDVRIFMDQYFTTVSEITQFVRSLSETE